MLDQDEFLLRDMLTWLSIERRIEYEQNPDPDDGSDDPDMSGQVVEEFNFG